MHPILTQRERFFLYLAAWLIVGVLLAGLLVAVGGFEWPPALLLAPPLALAYAFVCLAAFYVCRAFPLAGRSAIITIGAHLLAAGLSSMLWVVAGSGYATILANAAFPGVESTFGIVLPVQFILGMLLFILSIVVHYLLIQFEGAREAERKMQTMQMFARDAELRMLRAQVHPHFLFNSLNSISALTADDPIGARTAALRLADFLRTSLTVGSSESIPLAVELSLVDSFLTLEQVRFGDRLTVKKDIDERSTDCLVPPLMLQPLVENAVNHGLAHLVDGGTITLRTVRNGASLRLEVENPCDPDRPRKKPGMGLENVRQRLAAMYGSAGGLHITETSTRFLVALTIPVRTA